MKILGIDPGFAAGGYGVLATAPIGQPTARWACAYGFFGTEKQTKKRMTHVGSDDRRRVEELARMYCELIDVHRPTLVVYELPGGSAKGTRAVAALALSHATLVAAIGAHTRWSVPLVEITAGDVKAAVGLKAHGVTKRDVEFAVCRELRWDPDNLSSDVPKAAAKREHVFDALACAIAGERTSVALALRRVA